MTRLRARGRLSTMSTWLASPDKRPRVLIAGSGVAALEACLLLRDHVTADDVESSS